MPSSRRAFLGYTAATAATIFGPNLALDAEAMQPTAQPPWYDRPMRWAQIAFVEDDPGNYSPRFWLDYFERLHIDAVTISAGGAVAFYPTQIPLHYRSRWLGSMDTFGDLFRQLKARGLIVVARTDAHACHQDVYDAHPDWIMVNAGGQKVRHASDKDFWLTCALGPYNFDFMTSVHEEIMRKYSPDGIFTNRWAGSGMCYCEHCQQNFRAFSGLDLPRTRNPQDPARKQYIVWHQQRLFELWRLWNTRIQTINPNASYIANAGGGALSDLDMKTIGELAPTLFADRQGRSGLTPIWANGKNGKEYRATLGSKAIVGIFSVGIEDRYRWKDSVQSDDELRLWVVDGIAQGLRPWFIKFDCKVIDSRWMPVVEELYRWHYGNERYLRNLRPLARVAIVYSQQTASFYGGEDARAKVEDASLGIYQALIEARIPFEMVHDHLLNEDHLSRFRTLILPNIAALSTAQCAQLTQFVQKGGGLIATYETSLYNEWGVRQPNFGLASLFGADFGGHVEGPMLNSYLALDRSPSKIFHELLKDLDNTPRIINAANQVAVTPRDTTAQPLQVIPTYPDLPMEEVFPRADAPKGQPGVILGTIGQGRVAYFPGDVDRTFWETLNYDLSRVLRNAILWATNEPAPLTVQGKGILDVSLWEQKDSVTAHLVNLTNPMLMKGPVREIIPISAQQVGIKIPDGRTAKQVHLLVSGARPTFTHHQNSVTVDIPSIELHEVVAVDLD